jgi:hypothetical protein
VVERSVVDRELAAHWDPRARGVALASVPGWYFAGRTRVLRELVTWLSDPDLDHRAQRWAATTRTDVPRLTLQLVAARGAATKST